MTAAPATPFPLCYAGWPRSVTLRPGDTRAPGPARPGRRNGRRRCLRRRAGNPTSFFGYGEISTTTALRPDYETRMDVRRIVLGVSHQASERTRIVTEFEFEHGVTSPTDFRSLEQAYVEHRLSDELGLKATCS